MNGFRLKISTLLLLVFIAGCGGGSGTSGNGNTVYISASTKSGAPAAIFAHLSSNGLLTVNTTSFTVKSTAYTTTGTVPPSDVQINRVSYLFSPVTPGAPAFTPTVLGIAWPGTVLPGSTADLSNVPVIWPQDLARFAGVTVCNGQGYQYDATVTIAGTEVNSGASLSTDVHLSVFCP